MNFNVIEENDRTFLPKIKDQQVRIRCYDSAAMGSHKFSQVWVSLPWNKFCGVSILLGLAEGFKYRCDSKWSKQGTAVLCEHLD